MRLKKAFHLKCCIRAQEKKPTRCPCLELHSEGAGGERKRLSSRTKRGSFENDEFSLRHLFFLSFFQRRDVGLCFPEEEDLGSAFEAQWVQERGGHPAQLYNHGRAVITALF